MCDIHKCVCGWGYGSGKEYPGYRNALCLNSKCSYSYQAEAERKAKKEEQLRIEKISIDLLETSNQIIDEQNKLIEDLLDILSDPISTLECLPGNNEAPAKQPDLGICS